MKKWQQKPEVRKISNRDVAQFLKIPRLQEDRDPNKANVYEIDQSIDRHTGDNLTLHVISWATVYVRAMDITYRINGNHTGMRLNERDLREINDVFVCFQHFVCDTRSEALQLYREFDKRSSSKKIKAINQVVHADGKFKNI